MDTTTTGNVAIETGLIGLFVTVFQIGLNVFVLLFQQVITGFSTGLLGLFQTTT